MAEAPTNTEPTSALQIPVDELKTPKTPKSPVITDVTVAQLLMSKTPPLAPLTPSSALSGKRQRLKPTRFDSLVNAEKKRKQKRSPSKDEGEHDHPLRKRLSLGKENGTKESKAPALVPVELSQAMIRAREIQSTLGNEYPSFIKTMLKSHVLICFWMGLPLRFSRKFLPKEDSLMVVEDENGEQCEVKLIANRFGLSGGWKKFAVTHKLLEGDVLIFQLVESCKFKVYIVRENDSKEVDGAVKVINQDTQAEHKTPSVLKIIKAKGATVKKHFKLKEKKCSTSSSPPLTKVKRKYKRSMVNSQVQGGHPEPNISLKDVKTFKDFHIMVNKECIDLELTEEIRKSYYNLCIGKNEILHESVREGLFHKLVAGVIGETVNIANMISNCKLTTTKEEFDVWDSSLQSFELIGMKVGFLRDRIRSLATVAIESEDAKRYVEAKEQQKQNAKEIKILKAKLLELYESNRMVGRVVDGLKEKVEGYEIEFQKRVDAPW